MNILHTTKLPFNGLTLGSACLYLSVPKPTRAVIVGITHNPTTKATFYRLLLIDGDLNGQVIDTKLEKTQPLPLTEVFLTEMGFIKKQMSNYPEYNTYKHANGFTVLEDTLNNMFLAYLHDNYIDVRQVHVFQLLFNMHNLYGNSDENKNQSGKVL